MQICQILFVIDVFELLNFMSILNQSVSLFALMEQFLIKICLNLKIEEKIMKN